MRRRAAAAHAPADMQAPATQPVPAVPAPAAPAKAINGNGNIVVAHSQPNGTPATEEPLGAIPSFVHTVLGAPYEPPLSPADPDWALHVPTLSLDAKDQGTADAW